MSKLIINKKKLFENLDILNNLLEQKNIKWTLVTKILSGNKIVLNEILSHSIIKKIHSFGDSRISNLKTIKRINSKITTMYIKPPSIKDATNIVKYADISLNTSLKTITKLNQEAKLQNKIHKVIIMVELGELREGVIKENLLNFYSQCFNLTNIKIIGIGANLGCMYGVEPTISKMKLLSDYKKKIEKNFNIKLKYISGGSSINLSLLNKDLPKTINHLRIGESAFLGTDPITGKKFKNLNTDVFNYQANIIELKKKRSKPDGKISNANIGHTSKQFSKSETYRAIVDFGILDVDADQLTPKLKTVTFIGTTSDMSVYDLKQNIPINGKRKEVGSTIKFIPKYMAVAKLFLSKYTEIEII